MDFWEIYSIKFNTQSTINNELSWEIMKSPAQISSAPAISYLKMDT